MDVNTMRSKFNDLFNDLISQKRVDNNSYFSLLEYSVQISKVKESKKILCTKRLKKSVKDYRMVRKYEILMVNGKERLIKPVSENNNDMLYCVSNEEVFDIFHTTHSSIGHGGRNRMVAEIKNKYCNITKESIVI